MPRGLPKPDAQHLQQMIDSFEISLKGARRSDGTQLIYLDAITRFAGHLLTHSPDATWFDPIKRRDIELYIGWMTTYEYAPGRVYSAGYINQQYRAVQQFFKWLCDEEDLPDPFAKLKPPAPDEKLVPVLKPEDMARLIAAAEVRPKKAPGTGKISAAEKAQDFRNRRDAAILRMFASSGARLNEISKLKVATVSLAKREAIVTGKGAKERTIKFDQKATQALDRYLRVRVTNQYHERPDLWLGLVGPMEPKSVYRMISRRGAALGIKIYPHMFRHTFSHNWLDKGGAEGDLMALNGWESGAMLRRYGASARAARAQRAYDRIEVMDGI